MVRESGFVTIDGVKVSGLVFPSGYDNVHAIQWYETWGEVECICKKDSKDPNFRIESLDDYRDLVDLHTASVVLSKEETKEETK